MGVWPWSRVELYHEHGLGVLLVAVTSKSTLGVGHIEANSLGP